MEEFDELMPTPDGEGHLDLQHRAWLEVDEVVWTMGLEVLSLSVAYNRLSTVSPELGDLKLLRVFDCSCNRITTLPSRIGVLRHLKKLKCNGNSLEYLPDELGKCTARRLGAHLEEVNASENKLVALPRSLGHCRKLTTILAQNNCLEMVPPTLADVSKTLERINLVGNPDLAMIPKKIRGDTSLILWVCRLHRENELESTFVLGAIERLDALQRGAKARHKELRTELRRYEEDRLELLRNTPTGIDRVLVVYEHFQKKAAKACVIS